MVLSRIYKDYIMASTKVLTKDPCLFGLQEMLSAAHLVSEIKGLNMDPNWQGPYFDTDEKEPRTYRNRSMYIQYT